MFVVVLASQRLGLRPWQSVAAYTAFLLAIGPVISHRHDFFSAILVLLTLYSFLSGRHGGAYPLLAASAVTKSHQAALRPVFLLYHYQNHSVRSIKSALLTFTTTCSAIAFALYLMSPGGLLWAFTHHAQRGIRPESTYGSLLLVGDKLGWLSTCPQFTCGSRNLTGAAADAMTYVSMLLLPPSLLAVYLMLYRYLKTGTHSAQDLVSSYCRDRRL